jgi:hypothetical protein
MTEPSGYTEYQTEVEPKKKRIFLWFFLAVQVLFLIWVIAGAQTGAGQPSDCGNLSAKTCNDASDTGTAIGVALIIVAWCAVDFLLGVVYFIYRLGRRP